MMDSEIYFANARLKIECEEKVAFPDFFDEFKKEQPFENTFSLSVKPYGSLPERYVSLDKSLVRCTNDRFDLYDYKDSWVFAENIGVFGKNSVLVAERDYKNMILYLASPRFPIGSLVRVACESGLTRNEGMPLHASLIEKNGEGIVFLGPSGMGKSTQAKLWERYEGADFLIGDRPALRRINGRWYGYGMPWDGKDSRYTQKSVPIRALVSLEQAKENEIRKLDIKEAMVVLLKQAMMPMWDDGAMAENSRLMWLLSNEVDFFHLKNLADEGSVKVLREILQTSR